MAQGRRPDRARLQRVRPREQRRIVESADGTLGLEHQGLGVEVGHLRLQRVASVHDGAPFCVPSEEGEGLARAQDAQPCPALLQVEGQVCPRRCLDAPVSQRQAQRRVLGAASDSLRAQRDVVGLQVQRRAGLAQDGAGGLDAQAVATPELAEAHVALGLHDQVAVALHVHDTTRGDPDVFPHLEAHALDLELACHEVAGAQVDHAIVGRRCHVEAAHQRQGDTRPERRVLVDGLLAEIDRPVGPDVAIDRVADFLDVRGSGL